MDDVQHNVPAKHFESITEKTMITHSFICTDGKTDAKSFIFKSIVFTTNDLGDIDMFKITLEIPASEVSSRVVSLYFLGVKLNCQYSVPNPYEAYLDTTKNSFSDTDIYRIKATKLEFTKSTLMRLSCETPGSFTFSLDVPIYFAPNSDPWPSASGDPHFKQIVLDYSGPTTKSICYDVTGSPGDYLYIAGFSLSGIQIYGQLKDDYYIHRIFIKSDSNKITVSTNYITLDNGKLFNWTGNMQKTSFKSKHFQYLITGKYVFITSEEHPENTIKIQKSLHSLSEIHLDASFKLSPSDYKEMDGLIGDIGKKNYKFHSEVQLDGNIGSKFISIDIDDNLMKGERVERNKEECWLINVNDILKPFKISKYLYKNVDAFEKTTQNFMNLP
ncbi:DgyrCDS14801 [Dimorphilus gyrociliatus]|uniref:DgyrCDS14801 n=1 Tax=Dimorphilus gyrociliatus TaxID=2664684 RepID=A0A7I8WEY9_9ANNE|nr:DgyrCDS14801 [Dimorphilus gyrociliatus]